MIYNIRGTSGSGKTHLVRQIVQHYGGAEITDPAGRIFGYRLPARLRVLGRYDTAIKGGGVDNITSALLKRLLASGGAGNSMDAVEAQVRRWAGVGYHVLFEGLIVSDTWPRWVNLARDFPTHFLFLDTPLEVCYARVMERNGGRVPKNYGTGKSSLEQKHQHGQTHLSKASAGGLNYTLLEHTRVLDQLREILEADIPAFRRNGI